MHTTRSASRRARLTIAATVVLAAALPAVARADSIVYIHGGNVWSATPNGARKVQLTKGGDWHSPTQSDNGTIAAVKGLGLIHLMARDGRVIRTISTPPAPTTDGSGGFAPNPVLLSLSPDARTLAYSYVAVTCPLGSTCGGTQRSTFYTRTGSSQADPIAKYGQQQGVTSPEWLSDDRTVLFGGCGRFVAIDELGGGDNSFVPWITCPESDVSDGEISRNGRYGAFVLGYGATKTVGFYTTPADVLSALPPSDVPTFACSTSTPDARYADPTFSRNGLGVAFASSEGIDVLRFDRIAPQDCHVASSTVLETSGSEPDWGPADPPAHAARPTRRPARRT